jgi:putative membrane protein
MNRFTITALVAILALTACDNRSSNQTQSQSPPLPPSDNAAPQTVAAQPSVNADGAFVESAAIAGMFEVESSREGFSRATKPELKQFAQMMIDDHAKANDELKTLVSGGQVSGVTAVPTELDATHQTKIAELKAAKNGPDFDAKYAQAQLEGHQQAVALFEAQSTNGQSDTLKKWAAEKLPTLKAHLARIEPLAAATPPP